MSKPYELVNFCEIDKYATKSYCAVHDVDSSKNLGDITKVDENEIPEFNCIFGGSPCFPGDALVLCSDGLKPIEQVEVGDYVVTHNGRLRKVLRTGHKMSDTVFVKGAGTSGIECTPNHPFYSCQKIKKWNNDIRKYQTILSAPTWEEAKRMVGRMWFNLTNIDVHAEIPSFANGGRGKRNIGAIMDFKFTPSFFYFVGRWLGDGWANIHNRKNRKDSPMKRVYVCCPNENDEVNYLRKKIMDSGLHFSESQERTTHRFVCSSTQLYDWITNNFGKYAHGKKIPLWAYTMPIEFKKQLIDGYIESDGYVNKFGHTQVSSINRGLMIGLKILMGQLGYASCINLTKRSPRTVIEGRIVTQKDSYTCCSYVHSRSSVVAENGWWGMVRSVRQCRKDVPVYNLEVEEDNSYTVDGIAVHNCQDFSVAGKGAGSMWKCRECGHEYNPITVHWSKRHICPECGSDQLDKTRSSLLVEWLRVIRANKPKWGIYENVKNITGKKHRATFDLFIKELEEYGYNVYWKVLNAKDYGVPQNRERVYVIIVRKELDNGKFVWPAPFDNGIRLKDVLEPKVDDKYYVNTPAAEKLIAELVDSGRLEKAISNTVRTGGATVR